MTSAPVLGVTVLGFSMPLSVIALGVFSGISYGLLAVGMVLIYRTSRIVNFALSQTGILGAAVLGLLVERWHLPYYTALPLALGAGGAASGAIELLVVRRLHNAPRVMSVVATLGAGAFIADFSFALNPASTSSSAIPSPPGMPTFDIGALLVNQGYSALLVLGPIAVALLTLFLRYSRTGLGIRCASANPEAARMAGISVNRMSSVAWIVAGVLAALTAILIIPASGFVQATSFGPSLLLRALAAAVLARMYSFPVAFLGGVGIGIVEQLVLYNYPQSPDVADLVLFVLILAALLVQHVVRRREAEGSGWAAVAAWRPVSRELQRLPEVRVPRWGSAIGAVALALLLPVFVSNDTAVTLSTIIAFSIVGLSVGIITGLGGQLSLGQFAIAAVGAVVAIQAGAREPFGVAILLGGVGGAVAFLIIGLPTIRSGGLMLTVTTLGFALVVSDWGLGQSWALGEGRTPRPPAIAGHSLGGGKDYYYFALAILLVALLITWNVRRGAFGRALIAIRDNEDNARAFTLSPRRVKLEGFLLAGFVAGIGGAVYGFLLNSVDPTAFPVQSSIDVVAMTVIGGITVLLGPIIGAFYIIGLPGFVPLDSAGLAATQLGWLVLILYLPGGIAQGIEPLRTRYLAWAAGRHGLALHPERHVTVTAQTQFRAGTADVAPTHLLTRSVKPRMSMDNHTGQSSALPVLEARGLTKSFGGIAAVKDVSLAVSTNETVGLIGPNGAGKTTLFGLLTGFTRPDQGAVRLAGLDISRLGPEQRGRRGLIRSFQDAALFPTLTVSDTIRLAFEPTIPSGLLRSVAGLQGAEAQRQAGAVDLIDVMGLGPYARIQIQELSTGTRRIVELACMMALSPSVLLLDEPCAGIAQRETEALAQLLAKLRKELALTMLIIEHDLPMIMSIADRVVALDLGSVLAVGTPLEIQGNPDVIAAYFGENCFDIQPLKGE